MTTRLRGSDAAVIGERRQIVRGNPTRNEIGDSNDHSIGRAWGSIGKVTQYPCSTEEGAR
jgi:hypothetical protein